MPLDTTNWTQTELQTLVLTTGSKKAFGDYLGLDAKATDQLWRAYGLMAPTEWLRAQPISTLTDLLFQHGSFAGVATYTGTSEATVKRVFQTAHFGQEPKKIFVEPAIVKQYLEKYKSARLAARMITSQLGRFTEGDLRKTAKEQGWDTSTLLDYTFSNHSNAKGRRAELIFKSIRGDRVLEDLNVTGGSQAPADFRDRELGIVNVKSSRRYKYRESPRQNDPFYYKFSTAGREAANFLYFICLDEHGREMDHHFHLPASDPRLTGNSVSFTRLEVAKMELKCRSTS